MWKGRHHFRRWRHWCCLQPEPFEAKCGKCGWPDALPWNNSAGLGTRLHARTSWITPCTLAGARPPQRPPIANPAVGSAGATGSQWLRGALYRKVTCSELFPSGLMLVSRSPNFASVQSKQRAGAKSQSERAAAARPAPTLVAFPCNNGISFPNATFWGGPRSCEVAIIWPDGLTQKFVKKGFCWKLRPSKVGETWGVNV